MFEKLFATIVPFMLAAAACAAPSKVDPVAEGFPSWEGVTERNYFYGRSITPSDLRQRAVLVIALKDDENLQKHLLDLIDVVRGLDDIPPSHGAQWDTMDSMPRKCVIVVTFHGPAKSAAEDLKKALTPDKDAKKEDAEKLSHWYAYASPAFYKDVTLAGAEPITEFPYVYVMDGKSATPTYKSVYKPADNAKIRNAVAKAKSGLPRWREFTGVEEVQFFKDIEKKILAQKPLKPCIISLKASIGDKNPEKAREAQIMYDALNQYCSDLKLRISCEFRSSPARAYADAQKLFRYFPQEKKAIAQIDMYLKTNKSAVTLGKMYEKYLEWSQPDFVFKNASEAKKAVQLVNTWKKPLEKMSQDTSNMTLQGEASLILAQIDTIAEVLMTKVPQK